MLWMPLTSVVRIKNVRYVLTKEVNVRIIMFTCYFVLSTDNEKNNIYLEEFEIQAFPNVLHSYKNGFLYRGTN